jgi:hypothetical protein
MTYGFNLSRRIARFRGPVLAALLVALGGCDNTDAFNPESSTPADVAADAPTIGEEGVEVLSVPAEETELASASYAGGIPIGHFAQPNSAFGSLFNGALQNNGPLLIMKDLAAVKARGGKVVLMFAGNERYYKQDGHFSLTKWKARVDRFKGINFASYIRDGTIIGHYLIDEPNDPANWRGRPVPPSVLEEMARYSKQRWPNMATIVRVEPDYLGSNHRYLDAAWAQYLSRKGSASDFIRRNVAHAQKRGLGLVVGLNLLKGGKPNGTKMTANEVESWGSALLSSSYPCAFISWQYNSTYLSGSGIRSAMAALRRKAENRRFKSCRG